MRTWLAIAGLAATAGCGGESKSTGGTAGAATMGGSSSSVSSTTSDSTVAGPTGSGGTGSSGATGSSGGTGGSGSGGLDCPSAPPDDGASCSIETAGFRSAHCSWGDDPRPECRTRAICNTGTWTVQAPLSTSCDAPPLPAGCSDEPPDNGTACDEPNAECWYDSGTRCTCSPCSGGSGYPVCGEVDPPEWWCSTPPSGCPVPAAQAGTPCDEPEASCGLDCALPIVCQEGVWQWQQNGCPICAAPDTPIGTPSGEQPIAALRVGDLVYTVEDGAVVARPLVRVGSTRVRSHSVLRVILSGGATLEMSPGHPTSDGRTFRDLEAGDWLDEGHRVVSSTLIPFDASHTHDILPASRSGSYFAAGVLVGSTLAP